MGDTDISKYPSAAVQQCSTKIAFLIDCDGGLGTAFHPKKPTIIKPDLIKDFPSNSDIFLFFNIKDAYIADRLNKLGSDNPNVHAFPNIKENSRNGADMNLSFMLGAINDKYDKYVIVTRHDQAYEEIKERLEYTHPQLKNHVEVHHFNSPKELAQYVRALDKFQKGDQHDSYEMTNRTLSKSISPITVTYTLENIFHHCPLDSWEQSSCLYRFKKLLLHLDDKHPDFRYQYCSTCEEFDRKKDPYEKELFDQHLRKEHRENDAGFRLSILPK